MKKYLASVLFMTAALALWVPLASANSITITTPGGSTQNGLPVDASATFVTSANTLTITLTNLEANPTSVVQNLSGLQFVLSSGQTSGTLFSSSGLERTIASNGTYTDGLSVGTAWDLLSNVNGGLKLNLLGSAAVPTHTIIGPPDGSNLYSDANNSIAGNGPHNPFLAGDVTFILTINGLTANDTVNSAIFSFNTSEGFDTPSGGPPVPEPTSLLLLGSGLVGLAVWRYKK